MIIDFKEVEKLLEQGNIKETLILLKEYSLIIDPVNGNNQIISIQSRLSRLQKEHNSGVISHDVYTRNNIIITNATINFYNDLKYKHERFPTNNNQTIKEEKNDPSNILKGVWLAEPLGSKKGQVFIWSLFPGKACTLNILDRQTQKIIQADYHNWKYNHEDQIITQTNAKGEISGLIEWITPVKFKLTVFNLTKSIMIYKKIDLCSFNF